MSLRGTSTATGRRDDGAALVMTLVASMLLAAIGLSLLLLTDIEATVSASHRDGAEVFHAADGAIDHVVQELALLPDWTPVLSGAVRSRLAGPLVLPAGAGGGAIDAGRLTAEVQQAAYGGAPWGVDTPRWRLFTHGPASDLADGAGLPSGRVYVLVWISDDVAERDGNVEADSNGVVVVRARAMGVRRSQCDIQAVVGRTEAAGILRRISWRVMR